MKKIIASILALSFLFMLNSCDKKKKNVTEPEEEESVTVVVSSTSSGSVETDAGFGLSIVPGVVPPNESGQSASVTFSIETGVDSPAPIMTGAALNSSVSKFGPEGFNFQWPVRTLFPYSGDVADLSVAFYDPLDQQWVLVPKSEVDINNNTITADVLELGYYAVVKVSSGLAKDNSEWSDGGFMFSGESGYYYTLTVASVTNFKYPWQARYYGNRIVGSTGSSGSNATGGPRQPTTIHLPQATYQIWITRTQPGTLSQLPKIYTYSVPASGTISQAVTYTSALSSGSGWATLQMPGGGNWVEGRPDGWAAPTTTYGTGEFQATLTWINSASATADIDLHLFGPNDLHVYWSNEAPSGSAFQLDRDWISALGYATENIYSVSTIPSGNYEIYVNLYSLYAGSSGNYNVRIIYKGAVNSYSGSLSTPNQNDDDKSKMVKIRSFTK